MYNLWLHSKAEKVSEKIVIRMPTYVFCMYVLYVYYLNKIFKYLLFT